MKNAIQPSRAENYPQWYQEIIKAADLAENSSVRGCMIIKPWGYAIWERIQQHLDKEIKSHGHQNIYCPLFIPLSQIEKEAQHISGFAKECAVVTHSKLVTDKNGNLTPDGKLQEPLIVRPTSEMVIGELFSKWVQSHRDLPLLVNQWANIVRWEMRTRMFLRTSEFLWQEGHTAHQSAEQAHAHSYTMLNVYSKFCREFLALDVIPGEKPVNERFPGAENTYTIEALMQDGKALQMGTSHFLGQNFSKASNISYQNSDGSIQYVWTTSWGVTTRLIGGLIMSHSDDNGLVLPPSIAPYQIVILPIIHKKSNPETIYKYCDELAKELQLLQFNNENVRTHIDKRELNAGEKNWSWVKKGVPIRIEIGAREVEQNTTCYNLRINQYKDKSIVDKRELISSATGLLKKVQDHLYNQSKQRLVDNLKFCNNKKELYNHFEKSENPGFAVAYWHQDDDTEKKLQQDLSVSIRCHPITNELANWEMHGPCCFNPDKNGKLAILAKAY